MSTNVTRRSFSSLTLGGLASASVWTDAVAAEDWPTRLQKALDAMSTPDRTLRLTGFRLDTGPSVEMSAVVEMTWQPGTRSRRFLVTATTETDAAETLLAQIEKSLLIPVS